MVKTFEFEDMESLVKWFFETIYEVLKKEYTNPFHLKIVMRVARGIEKGLLENIKNQKQGGKRR